MDIKYIFIFITIIYISFINVNGQSQLSSSEYNCLNKLAVGTGLTFATFPNSSVYDFCYYTWILQCSGSVVTRLVEWPIVSSSFGVSISSFTCFSSLKDIKLTNALMSDDFLYSADLSYLNSLELVNPNITINNVITPLKSLKVNFSSSLSIFYLKYLKNVESFSSPTSIDTYYNELSELNNVLKNLDIYTKSLPNLSNFHNIQTVSINSDYSFDISSLNNNIGYQQGSFSLVMSDVSSNGLTRPCTDFPSDQIKQNQLLTDITFTNICFNTVNTKIDISNAKISSLTIINPGSDFNYLGNFPFEKMYAGSLYIATAKFSSVQTTSDIFFNTTSLTLTDCQISGTFTSKNVIFPKLKSLRLDRNLVKGSIDNSWCSTQLNVSQNLFTNNIPDCFACYLNDPNIYNLFNGNNFENLNSETICQEGVIVPSISSINNKNGTILISGQNLPILISQIESSPSATWNTIVQSSSFGGTLSNIQNYKTIDLSFINKYKFTLSLIDQEPILSNITYDPIQQEFIINGSYFTYDITKVKFIIGNTECTVKSSTFYKIICSISSTDFEGYEIVSFSIEPYPVQKLLLDKDIVNIGCPNSCTDSMCNMVEGVCVYCSDDATCNGGKCTKEGICVCPPELTGATCLLPNHYVSNIVPSTVSGGLVTLNGYFGNTHNNATVTIGNENCKINEINNKTILCNIGPGNGIKSVNVTQNNVVYIGVDMYKYQELVNKCPNNCSKNGLCSKNTGFCNCFEGWGTYDCSIKLSAQNDTQVKVNETGTTQINNQEIQYEILFLSINEINILGESVKEYPLVGKWSYNKILSNDSISVFSHVINETIILTSTIEEVKESKQFNFADINFTVEKGGVKTTISISNWVFSSSLNTLQVRMKSSIDQIKSSHCDTDTLVDIIDEYDSINYITISKNGKILYSRILDRILSNGKPTFSKASLVEQNSNSVIIALNLGHCDSSCILDPDFSLLIDNSISNPNCKSSRKWLIPVVVIVPVVSISILFVIFFVLYKKHRFLINSKLNEIKLK